MLPAVTFALACALLAAIPPLSPEHQQRLATAVDGRDHVEDAFLALVEHTRSWTEGSGDASIRLQPDFDAMLRDPNAYRGDLCRITGRIDQQTQLPPPFEHVSEWFVRDRENRPILVYVVAPDGNAGPIGDLKVRNHVEIDARYYKRVDFIARDGRQRSYPAFVGTFPRAVAAANPAIGAGDPLQRMWLIGGPVVALLIVFIFLRVFAFRARSTRRTGFTGGLRSRIAEEEVDASADLPDDPAEALAELKRRATSQLPVNTEAEMKKQQ